MNEHILGWKIPDPKDTDPFNSLRAILHDEATQMRLVSTYDKSVREEHFVLPGLPLERPPLSVVYPDTRNPEHILFDVRALRTELTTNHHRFVYFSFCTTGVVWLCEETPHRSRSSHVPPVEPIDGWANGIADCMDMVAKSIINLYLRTLPHVAHAYRTEARIRMACQRIMSVGDALAEARGEAPKPPQTV